MISPEDLDLIQVTDDPKHVVEIIRSVRRNRPGPPADTAIG